jgi:hypothetical protein
VAGVLSVVTFDPPWSEPPRFVSCIFDVLASF